MSIPKLHAQIRSGQIRYGGNKKFGIYGRLNCKSGKRMKAVNRVFFSSVEEAIQEGYRPCGHCLKGAYQVWKKKQSSKTSGKKTFDENK